MVVCGCVHAIYIVSERTMCACITVRVLDTLAHAAFVVWCNVAVLDGFVTIACECCINFLLLRCSLTEMTDHENQLYQIQSLIDQLPPVNHATLKRVIGHLNRIKEQEEKNKMGLNNIVKIFGPTLMTVDGDTVSESFVCVCIHT